MSPARALRIAGAVAAHPSLWWVGLRQWRRTTPRGWWRRAPFLPVPTAGYLHFRLVTQYGDAHAPVATHDVLNYLSWCKQQTP